MNNKPYTVFDFLRFLEDFKIDHRTSGHKHCSPGWVHTPCPFCKGQAGYHLGFHLESGNIVCWRCGKKKLYDVLKAILGYSSGSLTETIGRYRVGGKVRSPVDIAPLRKGKLNLPAGIVEIIPKKAEKYLTSRNFDCNYLIETWKIKFTGPTGPYKYRIIAPIWFEGRMVSYQGRDYTGSAELRYKACKKENEVRDHKECLYGSWLIKGNRAIVVEGITDAWRVGPGAIATFGIAYTVAQINLLSKYKKLFLLFDSESQAIKQAESLGGFLKLLNPSIEIEIIELEDGDPAELDQKEANYLVKNLL